MKALVLFSGGIDSTTCLGMAVQKYSAEQVLALSVSYGQKHIREMKAAEQVAAYYGVEQMQIDLAKLFEDSNCPLLGHSTQELPKGSYREQLQQAEGKPVSTYVPFRNGLFLSCAASIALSRGCGAIYYGAHADDAAGNAYPDCSIAFQQAINDAVFIGSGEQLRIEAPFISKTKAEVVRMGLALQAPYHLTWSCYEGSAEPCGKCATCIDRAKAFRLNGVEDPLLSGQ